MSSFQCPVCGELLRREERVLRCQRGHSYDMARQGYVNLLMSNQSSAKRHGDDKTMVLARQAFLDGGWFRELREEVCRLAARYSKERVELLDVGCGEGWYTRGVKEALEKSGKGCDAMGIDISKEALIQCAKRDKSLALAVASVNALPVPDGSQDLLLNIFAPNNDQEFRRVLRPGGVLLRVVPLEEHLMGLKRAIYDHPYPNPTPEYAPEGFRLLEQSRVRGHIILRGQREIQSLFMMTPYYYKTGRTDQEKLECLETLETEIAFCIFAHERL